MHLFRAHFQLTTPGGSNPRFNVLFARSLRLISYNGIRADGSDVIGVFHAHSRSYFIVEDQANHAFHQQPEYKRKAAFSPTS
jgi:hypothetical protein